MSRRDDWEFVYGRDELLKTAKVKIKHHTKYLDAFQKEMREFVKLLKKRGLELVGDHPGNKLVTIRSTTSRTTEVYGSTGRTGPTGAHGSSGPVGYSGYSGYSGTASLSYHGNGQIQIEDSITKKLNEINNGIRHHIQMVREFDKWALVLEKAREEELSLDPDDVMFFFAE